MGQEEIRNALRQEQEGGNLDYFTSAEICRLIKKPLRSSIYLQLNQLVKFGEVEVVAYSVIPLRRGYRLKISNNKKNKNIH